MSYQSVLRPGLFEGQVFIVTGGGSGIGRCTAHELAALGARVALVGRKQEKVDAVKAEIEEDGGIASAHACDIREEESVKITVKAIIETHGGLNGVVNNAGGQFASPLTGINQKGWETVVRTNLTGGFLISREAYTQALSKTGGSIVNIVADMWGGMPGMGHSGAARAGMVNFTQTAAVEWAPSGVRVNAVAPGWIASSGMDNYPAHMKCSSLPRLVNFSRADSARSRTFCSTSRKVEICASMASTLARNSSDWGLIVVSSTCMGNPQSSLNTFGVTARWKPL